MNEKAKAAIEKLIKDWQEYYAPAWYSNDSAYAAEGKAKACATELEAVLHLFS